MILFEITVIKRHCLQPPINVVSIRIGYQQFDGYEIRTLDLKCSENNAPLFIVSSDVIKFGIRY
jgi:hypothetical protein